MQASTTSPKLSARLPRWLFGHLFSFETALVLFLFAGRYKADPRFSWIPVDLTLLFFALSVLVGIWILIREEIYLPGLNATVAGALFIFWNVATYGWTVGQGYAGDKVFSLMVLNLWCIIASTMIIANSPERVARFFTIIMLFGAWMALESIQLYFSPRWSGFIGLGEGDYLGVGRVISLATTVGIAVWIFSKNYGLKKVLTTALIGACFFVLLIGGGKGPLFALCCAIIVPLMLSVQLGRNQIQVSQYLFAVIAAVALGGGVIAYIIMTGGSVMTLNRMIGFFTQEGGGVSGSVRLSYFETSWRYWLDAPIFGQGIGSFPVLMFGMDIRSFPHNIVLEILLETGLVGLSLFIVFLYVLFRNVNLTRLRKDPALLCAVMLVANMAFNSMVSGDLPDNRGLFVMLGLLAMRPATSTDRDTA